MNEISYTHTHTRKFIIPYCAYSYITLYMIAKKKKNVFIPKRSGDMSSKESDDTELNDVSDLDRKTFNDMFVVFDFNGNGSVDSNDVKQVRGNV